MACVTRLRCNAAASPPSRHVGVEPEAIPWSGYDQAKFEELEQKESDRRSVAIDATNTVISLPPRGGDTRGWRSHWRRGLYGAVQSWAEGSRGNVIHMLAELAQHFGVESAVAEKMGFTCSTAEVRNE